MGVLSTALRGWDREDIGRAEVDCLSLLRSRINLHTR